MGRRNSAMQGIIFSACIIVVGILLFLDNVGLVRIDNYGNLWPLILVAIGLGKLFDARSTIMRAWAGIFIISGALLLFSNLHILHVHESIIWPLILIGFGVMTLLKTLDRGRVVPVTGTTADGTSFDATATFSELAIFGGVKRRYDSQDFLGGEATAVFGGIEIDLRKASMKAAQATLDINAVFGGVEVRVPEAWIVTVQGVGIFGGYEDKTTAPPTQDGAPTPRLFVTGSAVFGGVSIEN